MTPRRRLTWRGWTVESSERGYARFSHVYPNKTKAEADFAAACARR